MDLIDNSILVFQLLFSYNDRPWNDRNSKFSQGQGGIKLNDNYLKEVIDPGDRASKLAKEIGFLSHSNSKAIHVIAHQPDNFRGAVGFVWQRHILEEMLRYQITEGQVTDWTMAEEVENDGAGGKPQFFTLVGTPEAFRGLGWEVITMTADDFARSGRFPVVIDNEVNVKRITEGNFPLFQAMMEGYGEALKVSRLVNITGETAIMKHSITAFCDSGSDDQLILTWGASCIGLAHRSSLIDGSGIKSGQVIIGFWEPGYRCNGGTFFTNLILHKWGPTVQDVLQSSEARDFAQALTIPSQSYARTITSLLGWQPDGQKCEPKVNITGIAHITGGAVWGKFGELLPAGVGANLHSMPIPANALLQGYELSQGTPYALTPYQAYSTLHGGCGMLLACEPADADIIIGHAQADGIWAQVVGETTASEDREITIVSQFGIPQILSSLRPE